MATRPPPLGLRQKLALAVVITLAAALRLESLGQTSLAHFDEGVLAANGFNVWLKGPLHFQLALPLQAPPWFPWLIAAAHELTQIDWPILGKFVSAGLGVATAPLVFLLGRRLQVNRFGLAAAALLAASDLHVAYSRMALTDAPLTFFFTLSMYCLLRLFEAASPAPDLAPAGNGKERAAPERRGSPWPLAGWTLAAGLAAGAAWDTKYNGWMSLAAAFTVLGLLCLRDSLRRTKPAALVASARWRVLAALVGAASLAALCFAPWVWFVNRSFAGGYGAVTANHWNYFGGPAAWPARAWQLCESLPAFRHYGWLLTWAATATMLVQHALLTVRSAKVDGAPAVGARAASAFIALIGLLGALVLGADALLLLLAMAAVGPALVYGRFAHVLLAVWLGAFVVMIPFYHPYTRLLTPALPAAILLALWLLDEGWRVLRGATDASIAQPDDSPPFARLARALTFVAVAASLVIFGASHPFGWVPSGALWRRWSTRESYRSFGLAIDERTPADAVVLCQALPPMPLYCPRRWLSLDRLPFTELLPQVPADRPCFLAVDEWGAHAAGHDSARETLLANRSCLERIASTPNDLNIAALLDNLSPAEVAEKLAREPAIGAAEPPRDGANFLPPALQEMQEDVIVLYRVDRGCVDSRISP